MACCMQDIPSTETYLAVFQHMDTIVFFNGRGQEGQIWEQLTGSKLSSPNIEGDCESPNTFLPSLHTSHQC